MPFLPNFWKNSPIIQKAFSSVYSVGPKVLRSTYRGSIADAQRSCHREIVSDKVVEDGLEVHQMETLTQAAMSESPKKAPRIEFPPFEVDERPLSSNTLHYEGQLLHTPRSA